MFLLDLCEKLPYILMKTFLLNDKSPWALPNIGVVEEVIFYIGSIHSHPFQKSGTQIL